MEYKFNSYQTTITDELLESLPREVKMDLLAYIESIPFINWLLQPEDVRGYAKDKKRYKNPNEEDENDLIEDPNGRIKADLTKPHILEDTDYFRERALFFDKYGKYTDITPNPNPKSDYAEFWREEVRRWKDGYVRPSDGEWIPGGLYFYWNYCPIWIVEEETSDVIKKIGKRTKGQRRREFPYPYLGDYLFYHYIQQAIDAGKHGKGLKTRGIGASFKFGSYSPRNMQVYPGSGNPNFHLASDKTYLKGDKGIWGKIIDCLDWLATHTPLPKLRLTDKKEGLELQLGYVDKYGVRKGLLSSVYGISVKDDPDKARGIRGPLIHYEEDGVYPNLESNWNINRNATEEGGVTYGFMMAFGTGGTEGADFEGSEKLFYHPNAYNIYGIPNVFDLNSKGESECGFFWGAYLNRKNCYCLKTGEPDIIKSLIEVLYDRWHVKQNSSDTKAITQKKAELCITPQDAVMRIDGTVFPVSDLKERITDIMPKIQQFTKGHYYGELYQNAEGDIKWKPKEEVKYKIIRDFPIKDNKDKAGGIEIFQQPIRKNGQIETYRYLAGCDPFDDDHSTTDSLGSCFIMDSFTETIVAEYTGRPDSTTFYENCLRLLKYYNAIANYECDKKGLYAHFYNRNALHLLCDNPEILQEKSLANNKGNFGNKKKGTQSNTKINQWARRLQAEWLVKTAYGEEETGIMNLQKVRSVGYLKEAATWHPDLNTDRVSAMGMLMILYQDTLKIEKRSTSDEKKGLLHNDEFFKRHAKGVNVEMAIN